jgi:hypothetical protein
MLSLWLHHRRLLTPLAAAGFIIALAGPASAQYPYPYPYPPYTGGFGPGNALAGQAQVMQASGDLFIKQEQARQQREKVNQDKLTTKRMAFDEAAYEKANTPTYNEDQERILREKTRRILNGATPSEITRGDSLNMLTPYIKALMDQGAFGPPIPLTPALLKAINVKVGTTAGTASAGLLKDGGKVTWPLPLRGADSKKLDKMLTQAVSKAVAGTLEQSEYVALASQIDRMQDNLRKQYREEKIGGSSFLTGDHFLDALTSSLKILLDPNVARFFDGTYAARGNTIPELVDYMTANGLTFGPATSGVEQPYFALHNAFVSYTRSAQSGGGFQSQNAPPPQLQKQRGG